MVSKKLSAKSCLSNLSDESVFFASICLASCTLQEHFAFLVSTLYDSNWHPDWHKVIFPLFLKISYFLSDKNISVPDFVYMLHIYHYKMNH